MLGSNFSTTLNVQHEPAERLINCREGKLLEVGERKFPPPKLCGIWSRDRHLSRERKRENRSWKNLFLIKPLGTIPRKYPERTLSFTNLRAFNELVNILLNFPPRFKVSLFHFGIYIYIYIYSNIIPPFLFSSEVVMKMSRERGHEIARVQAKTG